MNTFLKKVFKKDEQEKKKNEIGDYFASMKISLKPSMSNAVVSEE